jgi:hypothetical protein
MIPLRVPGSRGSSKASIRRVGPPVPVHGAAALDQIVEGVDAAQLTGVNQAHRQVTYLRPVQRPIEQCIFPMQNSPF